MEETTITVQPESPTSRFTAVNGKEQPFSASNGANGNRTSRRGSDERLNSQPRITPLGQEKLTITASTREDWLLPATRGDRHSYQPPRPYSNSEISHKRKSEGSLDPNSSSANSYHSHALASSTKQTPTMATTESDEPRQDNPRAPPPPNHRESYGPDVHYRQFIPPVKDHRSQGHRNDQWHHGYSQQQHTDRQIREALQGASQNMDAQQRAYISPDNDDRSKPYGGYGNDRREMSAQSDPKKRKRNFSNRTKTGCMTCRRRRKKCDENRPQCNNCMRGGFICSGYQQRGTWPKQDQKQPLIPLQSKIEYKNSPYAPQPSPYASHPGHPRREPLPDYCGQILRVDPPHKRHISINNDQPSASTIPSALVASPENNRLSATLYAQQTPTPVTALSSAYPDRQIKTPYDRQAPFHNLSPQDPRTDYNSGTPQSVSSILPQISYPQMHLDSPHTNPQVAAQLALGLANTARLPNQKEEMLAGRYYFPFNKDLVHERERCNAACWRFNSSTNPNSGATPEERARRFRDILQPRDVISPVTPIGRVGDNVAVEAPFNCDYGYNISIGQDVAIGRNCTILDTCEVTIGDRCSIGPNVSIYTTELPIDPKRRLGSRGPALGKKITIESDCWIGGGVTILAGVTIGKGSTVGAGSVVTRNVPMYNIATGNPAYVRRGIHYIEP